MRRDTSFVMHIIFYNTVIIFRVYLDDVIIIIQGFKSLFEIVHSLLSIISKYYVYKDVCIKIFGCFDTWSLMDKDVVR